MKLPALLIFAILILMSCQYAPYADDETTKKPIWNDVIGAYKFEKQTVTNDLSDYTTSKSIITLNTDSTFKAVSLPNFSGTSDFYYQGNISAKGRWNIEIVGGVSKWKGTESVWGLQLTSLIPNLQSMSFMGDKPPYKLLVTYGDPDGGAVMIFSKD